uniref:Methyltransferase FkbM domain-containing protein n=1 Tax=mine drainage metagenome TaxID=410659 RepID=E6Q5U3_9ZZZZ
MTTRELLARRRTISEERGDAFLGDPNAQSELQFLWNGSVLSDRCPEIAMDYFYPSTIGSALFFRGSFEAGEIAIVAALLAATAMPVVLDIGANIGLHTVRWCRELPSARVFAAEPVPRNQLLLERNIVKNGIGDRVQIVPAAFGAEQGIATIFESADGAYSSARAENAEPVLARHEVPRVTVDSFVAERSIARVDLLKIDVEGEEFSVLEGASATIERDAPSIFIEISEAHSGERADERIAAFLAAGYQAYEINNGIVTPYERHDDRTYNYLFIHPRRGLPVPQSAAEYARNEIDDLAYLRTRAKELLTPLRTELKAKDDEIKSLKSAAEERLGLLLAAGKRADDTAEGDIRAQLVEKEHVLLELKAALDAHRAGSVALQKAADERAALAERLARELAVAEGIGARMEAALAESRNESQALREEAAQLHARLAELESLANERLEVLQAMHRQHLAPEAPR